MTLSVAYQPRSLERRASDGLVVRVEVVREEEVPVPPAVVLPQHALAEASGRVREVEKGRDVRFVLYCGSVCTNPEQERTESAAKMV
jgi:hypothetical protein